MKPLLFLSTLIISAGLSAQSVTEARQLMYYERFDRADDVLHQVLKQDPANSEAWYLLGLSYLHQDAAKKAKDSVNKAPAQATGQPLYKVIQGQLYLNEGAAHQAKPLFDDALEATREKDAVVLGAVAKAHIMSPAGNASYALDLLEKAVKRDKRNAALYVLMGDAYRKMNNGSEAYQAYREAIEKDDRHAAAYHRLGEIFLTQKNADMYLDYFNQAIVRDSQYAPAYYDLYKHYFYTDAARAMEFFRHYRKISDEALENQYAFADLLYLNKDYNKAIAEASALLQKEGNDIQPRLYKLLAYSYEGLQDTAKAVDNMKQYFAREADSNLVVRDFESMAGWLASTPGAEDSAIAYLQKAAELQTDSTALYNLYKQLAGLTKKMKQDSAHAVWMGKYYAGNPKATNVDLFNWGLAHYMARDYIMADSVFGLYVQQYPEQGFGYYWQARSSALLDRDMSAGRAIPHYKKLLEVLAKEEDTETHKKWRIDAYAYLAAYETNQEKDYAEAIDYFEKILEVDPDNTDARKYISMLEKNVSESAGSK